MASATATTGGGDVDLAAVGALVADRRRCQILLALNDGRALPASVLADEAGVARSTASSHLAKLTEAGFLTVRTEGRNRYYRIAGPQVGELLEKLTALAPTRPVRSLREGSRAAQLRCARTCYDHLAGRLGVGLMTAMLDRGQLTGGDGEHHPSADGTDRLSAPGHDLDYQVTAPGWTFLGELGVQVPDTRRQLIRYCVDWSEQRHHLAGALGRSILDRFLAADWVRRRDHNRGIRVTPAGEAVLADRFGIAWSTDAAVGPGASVSAS
jgi:DNA-binding transcriptional ArsR family regulator